MLAPRKQKQDAVQFAANSIYYHRQNEHISFCGQVGQMTKYSLDSVHATAYIAAMIISLSILAY